MVSQIVNNLINATETTTSTSTEICVMQLFTQMADLRNEIQHLQGRITLLETETVKSLKTECEEPKVTLDSDSVVVGTPSIHTFADMTPAMLHTSTQSKQTLRTQPRRYVGKSRQELRREQQERLHGAQQLQKAEISRAFQFLNVSNDNSNASADGEEDHTVDEYNATDDEDNLNQSDEELQISGSTVERSREFHGFPARPSITTYTEPFATTRTRKRARIDSSNSIPANTPGAIDITARLASLTRYFIEVRHILVTRIFLSSTYGGSTQELMVHKKPKTSTSREVSRNIIFPTTKLNPFCPKGPGESGIIFGRRVHMTKSVYSVIVRGPLITPQTWKYLGEYQSKILGKMTPQEFRALSLSVQNKWAKSILEKQFAEHQPMRARIYLRKQGLALTADQRDASVESAMQMLKAEKEENISAHDVLDALRRGDEFILHIGMEFVAYDQSFADDMTKRYSVFKPPKPATKKMKSRPKVVTSEDNNGDSA